MPGEVPHEQYQIERKCKRKKAYVTRKLAHKRARQFYKLHGIRLYIYRCGNCGGLHLTKNILAKGKTL